MAIVILLILCNVLLTVIFKYFSKYQVDNLNAIVVNYFVCVLTSSLFLGELSVPHDFYLRPWAWSSLFLSVLFIVGFNLMALSYQKAGLSLTVIIQKMSLILSAGFAIVVYGELLTVSKSLGMIAAILAVILVNLPDKSENILPRSKWIILLPIIVFLMSGVIEILLYFVEVSGKMGGDGMQFTATSFGLAGLMGSFLIVYRIIFKKGAFKLKDIYGGVVLGLPNYLTIYLLVYLLGEGWDGSVLFPINNIGMLVLTSLVGFYFFNEQLNKLKVLGLICGIVAIVLITAI